MFRDGPVTIVEPATLNGLFAGGTAVLRLPNGNVVVVNSTISSGVGGTTYQAGFKIYSPLSEVVGSGSVEPTDPSITRVGSGFAIVGGGANPSLINFSPTNLVVQIFAQDGTQIARTIVGESGPGQRLSGDITTLNDGSLAVVWSGNNDSQVFLQRLDAAGNKLGGVTLIGSEGPALNFAPTIIETSDGGFVAAWTVGTATNDTLILGRKFDAQGNPLGSQFTIDPAGHAASDPQLAALPGGGFVITWVASGDGTVAYDGTNIEAQIFSASGSSVTGIFTVEGGASSRPEIASDAQGTFVIAYVGVAADVSGGRAFAKAYSASGVFLDAIEMNPFYATSEGYAAAGLAATSDPGVFEFTLQTGRASVRSGVSTVTGTLNTGPTPLGQTIQGTILPDFLYGDPGDNLFFGNGDADKILSIYRTPDTFVGGAGNDTVSYANSPVGIVANLSNETGASFVPGVFFYSIENLIGSPFSDNLTGNDAANRLEGGAGDDFFVTGRGGDTIIGGSGIDTVSYSDSNGKVVVNLTLGRGFNNYADSDTYDGIENISGSFFDDILIGDEGPNEIRGQAGNDLLIGALGPDVLIGGDGIDTIEFSDSIGTVFINLTLGQGFNNSAEGDRYFEIENVNGSRFDDFIIGDAKGNRLDGGAGNDTLIGALGADILIGGDGIDTASYEDNQGAVFVNLATGRGFSNAAQGDTYFSIENVKGSIYNDYLIGDSGANRLDGNAGDDILIGGLGADVLVGGAGFDTASYEDNWGAVFVNLLTGKGAGNAAEGDSYDSIEGLTGSAFADTFIGNDVRNVLNGKLGADTLTGNGGNDDFMFDTAIDGKINVDHITDFTSGQDRIVLDKSIFFTLSTGSLQANNLVFGTAATGGQNRIIYDQSTGQLWFDDDGNGSDPAILFAVLDNKPTLTSADFIVIGGSSVSGSVTPDQTAFDPLISAIA